MALLKYLSYLSLVFLPQAVTAGLPGLAMSILLGTKVPALPSELGQTEALFLSSIVYIEWPNEMTYCTGTLVREEGSQLPPGQSDLVLTASHCIDARLQETTRVVSSPMALASEGAATEARVANTWTNLNNARLVWKGGAAILRNLQRFVPNDIAVLRLDRPLQGNPLGIKRISADEVLAIGSRAFMVGYGEVPNQKAEDNRRNLTNPELYWKEYSLAYGFGIRGVQNGIRQFPYNHDTDAYEKYLTRENTILITSIGSRHEALPRVCSGDSGGPLIVVENGQALIAGVTSAGGGLTMESRNRPCHDVSSYTQVQDSLAAIMNLAGMVSGNGEFFKALDGAEQEPAKSDIP